jgi:hypothetical protein
MALLTPNDTFPELEEDVTDTREACFACDEAYVLLSGSEQKTNQQAWVAYQAIPSADYWSWLRMNLLESQPGRLESFSRCDYVDAVLRHQLFPQQQFRAYKEQPAPDNVKLDCQAQSS